MNTWKRVDITF